MNTERVKMKLTWRRGYCRVNSRILECMSDNVEVDHGVHSFTVRLNSVLPEGIWGFSVTDAETHIVSDTVKKRCEIFDNSFCRELWRVSSQVKLSFARRHLRFLVWILLLNGCRFFWLHRRYTLKRWAVGIEVRFVLSQLSLPEGIWGFSVTDADPHVLSKAKERVEIRLRQFFLSKALASFKSGPTQFCQKAYEFYFLNFAI